MAEDSETFELEVAEEDILYYIVDEDDNEVGFAVLEDGVEVEYYYDGGNGEAYESVAETEGAEAEPSAEEEVIEIEIAEEDILYRIVDEAKEEIGLAILEDGDVVEYYYDGSSASQYEIVEKVVKPLTPGGVAQKAAEKSVEPSKRAEAKPSKPQSEKPKAAAAAKSEVPKERGYLSKMASIAGFHGNKARKKAEVQLDKVRGAAEKQVDKATVAVQEGGKKIKEKKEESDFGITREDLAETTADLNVIAKEGAETAKELKAAYDDIMDSFGAFVPKKIKRRLP